MDINEKIFLPAMVSISTPDGYKNVWLIICLKMVQYQMMIRRPMSFNTEHGMTFGTRVIEILVARNILPLTRVFSFMIIPISARTIGAIKGPIETFLSDAGEHAGMFLIDISLKDG